MTMTMRTQTLQTQQRGGGLQPDPAAVARRARLVLVASIGLTVALWVVPFGNFVEWPLLIFSTFAHELGHGLAAIAVGGNFKAMLMHADGSGAATYTVFVGRLGHATIAAGGLVGPALAAAVCFGCGRTPRRARICLLAMGTCMVLAEFLVVRTLFGWIFVGLMAGLFLAIGLYGPEWFAQVSLVFVGVQLALSVFSRADYLFTPVAATGSGTMPSDVAQIAEALVLPYWFWGGCCGLLSVLVLVLALAGYLRSPNPARPDVTPGRPPE